MPLRLPWGPKEQHQTLRQVISQQTSFSPGRPLPSARDLEQFGREGYHLNAIVHACVREIATSVAEPKIVVERFKAGEWVKVEDDGTVSNDPGLRLHRLLKMPNRVQSQYDWIEALIIDLQTFGNQFTHKLRDEGGKVAELWNLRPFKMSVIPGPDGLVNSYEYKRSALDVKEVPEEDVVHLRFADPLDDFYGLPPLLSASRSLDTDDQALDYVRAFFRNAGTPHGILTFKVEATPDERQRVKDLWRDQFGGRDGWHSLSVIDADVEYKEIGTTLDKLKMDHIFDTTETRLCMVFQVPPILVATRIGLLRATYANYKDARASFWRETLVPMYVRLEEKLNHGLVMREFGTGLRMRFDLSMVEELQESVDSKRNWALKSWEAGLATRNEAREIVELPEIAGGDTFKTKTSDGEPFAFKRQQLPATAPPADSQRGDREMLESRPSAAVSPEPLDPNDLPARLTFGADFTDKDAASPEWKSIHRAADRRRVAFRQAFLLNRNKVVTPEIEQAIEDAFDAGRLDQIENLIGWDGIEPTMQESFEDAVLGTMDAGAEAARKHLPGNLAQELSFDVKNPRVIQFARQESSRLVTQVSEKTKTAIRHVIAEGFEQGITPAESARRIMEIVGLTDGQAQSVQNLRTRLIARGSTELEANKQAGVAARRALRRRATLIARTETIRSASAGQNALWRQGQTVGLLAQNATREWIVTPDDRLDTEVCLPMAGQRRGLSEAFETGTGNTVTQPPAHPGCRCAMGLVFPEDTEE